MKKRILLVLIFVFCIMSFVNPINVKALEEDIIAENTDSHSEVLEKEISEDGTLKEEKADGETDEEVGFIIHNFLGQGGEEPPHDNPQTGDNIVRYLITLFVSIIGLVMIKRFIKENN